MIINTASEMRTVTKEDKTMVLGNMGMPSLIIQNAKKFLFDVMSGSEMVGGKDSVRTEERMWYQPHVQSSFVGYDLWFLIKPVGR